MEHQACLTGRMKLQPLTAAVAAADVAAMQEGMTDPCSACIAVTAAQTSHSARMPLTLDAVQAPCSEI